MNPLIRLKTTTSPLLITLALLCFGLLPKAQAVVPPPDGGYPGSTRRKGRTPFLASPAALGMWQLAGLRSTATLKATLTPLSAQERSFSIPQNKIPLPAPGRF